MFNHQICEFHQALGFFTGENGEISPLHQPFKGGQEMGGFTNEKGIDTTKLEEY